MRRMTGRFANRMVGPAIILALLATLTAAGCSKARSDTAIQVDIQSHFYADQEMKNTNVQVVVDHGRVTLLGQVPTEELRERAVKIAGATGGVKLVEDRIKLAPPAPTPVVASTLAPAARPPRAKPKRKSRLAHAPKPAPARKPVAEESAPAQAEAEPAQTQPPTQPATEPAAPPDAAQQPPEPQPVTIPAGTHLSVRTIQAIDSSKDKAGQVFRASLDAPIFVDGQAVVPAGADVSIRLAVAKTAGRMAGRSELELQLVKLVAWGRSYRLTSNVYSAKGKSRGKDTAKKVGVGAAVGAIIGAIAGGGKGAAIGAATGAGAGTAVQLATRGQQVKVPSETLLDFELQRPVTVTLPAPQQ